jgi:hypothetical protein
MLSGLIAFSLQCLLHLIISVYAPFLFLVLLQMRLTLESVLCIFFEKKLVNMPICNKVEVWNLFNATLWF